jgi:intein/homing endonuclease
LIGDGCVYKCQTDYNIKYEVKDIDSLKQFKEDLIGVYGLKVLEGYNPSGKTGRLIPYVRLRSKLAFDDLMTYCNFDSVNWYVPKEIFNTEKRIKREFIKALFDDDGSVIPGNNFIEVRLYSINLKGLKQIQRLLDEFSINSKIRSGYGCKRNVYGLVIVKDVKRFNSELGFGLVRKQEKLDNYLSYKI